MSYSYVNENWGQVRSKQSLSETVTNTGGTSVTISQVGISGTGFSLSGITAPVTLTAGQSAIFSVTFTPASTGSASGNLTVTSNASNPTLTIPLSGTGVAPGALGANPTSLSFGSVTVGSNQTLSETVTNTGGSTATISQVGISGTGFTLSGITAPVTLTAGQSATFSVTFTPGSAGSASGNVTITSNASNPTLTHSVVGHGSRPRGTRSKSDESRLRQRDRGKQAVSVRDSDQYRWLQRHDFSGRDQRHRVHPEWDHSSGDTDSWPKRKLQRHVHPSVGRKCEWQCHNYFERLQSDPDHPVVWHGSSTGHTRFKSHQSQLRQRDGRKQSGFVRDGDEHRGLDCDASSSRDQRHRVQPERDHGSGHTDSRPKRKLQRHVHTSVGRKCEWQRHHHLERLQSHADHTTVRNRHCGSWAAYRYSNHPGSWQRGSRDQRNGIRKPDSQRRQCYGHGCELEQLGIQHGRSLTTGDHPGGPECFVYSDLQPAGIRSGERRTHLHQQCSADYHGGNTDGDGHPCADTHSESLVEREHVAEHIRL